jgi:hypothetical protein
LPALQRTLLDGIHLPDLVRPLGTQACGSGFAPGRRDRLPAGATIALHRSRAGQGQVRMQILQLKQDVRRAPSGMLLVQEQGLLQRGRRFRRRRAAINWLQCRFALFAKTLAQSPHRAAGKTKFISDVSRMAALLQTRLNLPPQGQRQRCRHVSHSMTEGSSRICRPA